MQHSYALRNARRAVAIAAISSAMLGLALPEPGIAETVVPLAPFTSVTLRDGGDVILRHGATQRVTLLKGNTSVTGVTIADGGRLVIDRCKNHCPKGYQLVVEVLTPEIANIMVKNGGTIQSRGSFPRQSEVGAAVGDGGTIDLRSMSVDFVAAAVHDGGRIFTKPQKGMTANVAQGGAITYWGNPQVTSSIEHGGVVARGSADEADKQLPECNPEVPVLPTVPPVPSIRTRRTL